MPECEILPTPQVELPQSISMFHRTGGFIHATASLHHRYILLLALKQGGGVVLNGRLVELPEHHALLVFPYQFHQLVKLSKPDLVWLLIGFELSQAESIQPLRDTPLPLSDEALKLLGETLRVYSLECDAGTRVHRMTCHVAMLLDELVRCEKTERSQGLLPRGFHRDGRLYLIDRVAGFVGRHLHQPLSVEDVAREMNVSQSYLHKQSKRVLGMGLGAYIRRARILNAASMIRNTKQSICDIALACGFDSVYSFSRTFKQVMSLSPTAYRNNEGRIV